MTNDTLGERLSRILHEKGLKKKEFAASLGISANYVSLLVSGKRTGLSSSLAQLIEEKYGYSAEWVLYGIDDNQLDKHDALKNKLLLLTDELSIGEISAVIAFIHSMRNIERGDRHE